MVVRGWLQEEVVFDFLTHTRTPAPATAHLDGHNIQF